MVSEYKCPKCGGELEEQVYRDDVEQIYYECSQCDDKWLDEYVEGFWAGVRSVEERKSELAERKCENCDNWGAEYHGERACYEMTEYIKSDISCALYSRADFYCKFWKPQSNPK